MEKEKAQGIYLTPSPSPKMGAEGSKSPIQGLS
jgi:hypothetical protein